ncbi:hypothetical protein Bbelb_050750 [Branchiostoma belcheri]|nr:hypothetical protein Bbelb_050750 [Branchiostoma belcheri]
MATVITCNFARVAIHKSLTSEDGTAVHPADKKSRFAQYEAQFQGHKDFQLNYNTFRKNVDKIDHIFTHWNKTKHAQERDGMRKYIAQFSPEAWKQLSEGQKRSHQLQSERDGHKFQCKGCFARHRATTELFNGRLKDKTATAFFGRNPLVNIDEEWDISAKDIKAAANQWYGHANKTFQTFFGKSLAPALVHVPEVQKAFEVEQQTTQQKKQLKTVATSIKRNIEQVWQDQNHDVIVHQGTRESDRKYEERRMAMGFETTESAKKRARERSAKEASGKCKKKRRVGAATKWGTWDWDGIKEEVTSWPDGKEVNWRAYAMEKGVHNKKGEPAKNGGQMIQDWLIQEGINVHRFKTAGKSPNITPRPRRRKKRIPNSTNVSMPTPRSAKEMRKSLSTMIKDREIPIGERIVPKDFEKMVIDKESGEVKVKTFTVEGRKHPLDEVRTRMLHDQKKYMRIRTEEEYDEMSSDDVKNRLRELGEYREEDCITNMRNKLKKIEHTRPITVWEDSSQVANHGHMVYMACTTHFDLFCEV